MTIYDESLTLKATSLDTDEASVIAEASLSLPATPPIVFQTTQIKPVAITFPTQGSLSPGVFRLRVFYNYGGTDYEIPLDPRERYGWKNSQGFPCKAVTQLCRSKKGYTDLLPGRYDLSYNDALIDGAVPGMKFQLNDGMVGTERFIVEPGGFYISGEDRFVNVLLWENLLIGNSSASIALTIKNDSGVLLHNIVVSLVNRPILTQAAFGNPIFSLYQRSGYFPQPLSTSALTIANFDNTVIPHTAQLLINGHGSDVYDIGGNLYENSMGLRCDEKTIYYFAPGTLYEGLTFILSGSLNGSSVASLNIYENVWQISQDNVVWNTDQASLGDLDANETTAIYVRGNPFGGLDPGITHGFLQISTDEGELSIPLSASLIAPSASSALDNSLLLRCSVVTPEIYNNMLAFGITEAS